MTLTNMKRYGYVAWAVLWAIPAYTALAVFSGLVGVINLSVDEAVTVWKENT